MASSRSVIATSRSLTRCCRLQTSNQYRHFSQSTPCPVNPFHNLSHFSAAKEAQFLSKERKIPREEFHPYIQLIRSSEVDPFAPVPGASRTVVAALENAKAGKADISTAYTLAVSNLMSQVEAARRDIFQANSALRMMQEKHRRDERNALLFMFVSIGLLSFIMLKTRALEDLKEYAFGIKAELNDFDPKWLQSSSGPILPAYRIRSASKSSSDQETLSPQVPLIRKSQMEAKSSELILPSTSPPLPTSPSSESGWKLSRLFWAA